MSDTSYASGVGCSPVPCCLSLGCSTLSGAVLISDPAGDAEALAGLPTLALKLLGCIGDEVMTCEPQSISCLLFDQLSGWISKPQQLQEGPNGVSGPCLTPPDSGKWRLRSPWKLSFTRQHGRWSLRSPPNMTVPPSPQERPQAASSCAVVEGCCSKQHLHLYFMICRSRHRRRPHHGG